MSGKPTVWAQRKLLKNSTESQKRGRCTHTFALFLSLSQGKKPRGLGKADSERKRNDPFVKKNSLQNMRDVTNGLDHALRNFFRATPSCHWQSLWISSSYLALANRECSRESANRDALVGVRQILRIRLQFLIG